ncbi:MAG: hypothetical protein ACRYGM_17345 [Janthinobacterium lividum]
MINGPVRLAILAGLLALGAVGVTLALTGAGAPFALSAAVAAVAAGLVQWAALRRQPGPDRSAEAAALARIEAYRAATASLRHDLRGVLSPALMVSDRLLKHPDPVVERAGQAVVRSIERATSLLSSHREALADDPPKE